MNRLRAAALGALCIAAAATLAWSLAHPQVSLAAALVRAVADVAAVATLGLAVVPMFDDGRHRAQLAERATRPLILTSAVWTIAELVRLFVGAVQTTGASADQLTVSSAAQFALGTAEGKATLLCVVAAAVVSVVAAVAPRTPSLPVIVAAIIGMTGRSLSGHLAASPLGGLAVAVHMLAAALWCGALAALVLTVSHRGQWARVLPRFSRLSLVCVVVLLVCGTAGAAVTLDSPADLYATGYGRVLAAKIAVSAVLVGLGWHHRAAWLPAARSHRATADTSRRKSRSEVAIMVVALTLAAALAVTG